MMVSSCLVPPGDQKQSMGLGCELDKGRGYSGVSSGLASLHRKGVFSGSCLLSLGISKLWEGEPVPSQEAPQMSKHHKDRKQT